MNLIINTGSSSIKISLFAKQIKLTDVELKNHSDDQYTIEIQINGKQTTETILSQQYEEPLDLIIDKLITNKLINSEIEIENIGHRIVHGGEEFTSCTLVDSETIRSLEKYNELAPLHNPPAIELLHKCIKNFPSKKNYLVFDTAFHSTVPVKNFLYGLPYGYYENIKVRRYGFHGISYQYITNILKDGFQDISKSIICHLGSGSSICSVIDGKSQNHSFGFTPNENLIMATRSGEVDYDAIEYIKNKLNLTHDEVSTLLNKESGLLGISGYTKDMKTLLVDYNTNKRAKLAVDMYIDTLVDWIAKLYVQMNGIDSLIFTAGIGCGSSLLRELTIQKLEILGFQIDKSKNTGMEDLKQSLDITGDVSVAKIIVIPTDEAKQINSEIINYQNGGY